MQLQGSYLEFVSTLFWLEDVIIYPSSRVFHLLLEKVSSVLISQVQISVPFYLCATVEFSLVEVEKEAVEVLGWYISLFCFY